MITKRVLLVGLAMVLTVTPALANYNDDSTLNSDDFYSPTDSVDTSESAQQLEDVLSEHGWQLNNGSLAEGQSLVYDGSALEGQTASDISSTVADSADAIQQALADAMASGMGPAEAAAAVADAQGGGILVTGLADLMALGLSATEAEIVMMGLAGVTVAL